MFAYVIRRLLISIVVLFFATRLAELERRFDTLARAIGSEVFDT